MPNVRLSMGLLPVAADHPDETLSRFICFSIERSRAYAQVLIEGTRPMSERSKGFRIGAVCLFVGAVGLLVYMWANNGNDGPAVVNEERASAAPAPEASPPEPTVVNARATEETPVPTEPAAETNEGEMTPERVKQARSFLN